MRINSFSTAARKLAAIAITLFAPLAVVAAPVTIDPLTGLSMDFWFAGTVGTTQWSPPDGWQITVASNSLIDITVTDDFVVGDEFALVVDSVAVPWTSFVDSAVGTGTFFSGLVQDLLLTAGTHTFDILLTQSCCDSGTAFVFFSAVQAVPSSVPEPSTLAAVGLGLFGLAVFRRRDGRSRTPAVG